MKHEDLSDADFERAEDNLDAMQHPAADRPGGDPARSAATFSEWKRGRARQTRNGALIVLLIAAGIIALVSITGGKASRPSCSPNSNGCRQTADGYWVPIWYYGGLVVAQSTPASQRPLSTGAQPSAAELEQAGASPKQVSEAQDYGDSVDEDQSSDGGGDDSGGEDSGGDDGGDGG